MTNDISEGSWLHKIIKHGKWYLMSSMLTKGINVFLLRLYTEYLTPNDYGILGALNSVAALLPIILSLYLDSAFGRFFHEYKKDKQALKKLFSTIYWFVLGYGSLLLTIIIITSSIWVEDLLDVNDMSLVLLSFIPPLFLQIGSLGMIFLRQNLHARQTASLELAGFIINILVTLPLLISFGLGVKSRLMGGFVSALFLFIYYTIYFKRKGLLTYTFHRPILKQCLMYSIPLIPNIAGGWIAGLSDRLVIAKYVSVEAVGLYSVGFALGQLLYFLQDAITQVLDPMTMSGLVSGREGIKAKNSRISLHLWVIMLYANLGLYVFSDEIIWFFAAKTFNEAAIVIPIIGFSYVLGAQHRIISSYIQFHKKNWIISSGGILQAIVNLGLNFWLVPKFGYLAAAVTTIISIFVYSLWLYALILPKENPKLHLTKMLVVFLFFSISCTMYNMYLLESGLVVKMGYYIAISLVVLLYAVKSELHKPLLKK